MKVQVLLGDHRMMNYQMSHKLGILVNLGTSSTLFLFVYEDIFTYFVNDAFVC